MQKPEAKLAIAAAVIVGLNSAVWAQNFDAGKAEYQSSCAACHGVDGKGKGPLSTELKVPPADLTVLAKKNNGLFPVSTTYQIIDGRQAVIAHGTRDMPIWGNRYTLMMIEQAIRGPSDLSYDPEAIVRIRILSIIDYLNRIQEK
jgi:mono/diheme cytochrome c family protein